MLPVISFRAWVSRLRKLPCTPFKLHCQYSLGTSCFIFTSVFLLFPKHKIHFLFLKLAWALPVFQNLAEFLLRRRLPSSWVLWVNSPSHPNDTSDHTFFLSVVLRLFPWYQGASSEEAQAFQPLNLQAAEWPLQTVNNHGWSRCWKTDYCFTFLGSHRSQG